MKEATGIIRRKLTELKEELVKNYGGFKGSELEETIGKLLIDTTDTLKELPVEEVETPVTEEPKEPQSSIGSRLGAENRRFQEETAKGDKYYFGG